MVTLNYINLNIKNSDVGYLIFEEIIWYDYQLTGDRYEVIFGPIIAQFKNYYFYIKQKVKNMKKVDKLFEQIELKWYIMPITLLNSLDHSNKKGPLDR